MIVFLLKRIIGVLLLAFGIVALVTPLTPGAWLGLLGLELLGATFLLPGPVRRRWEGMKGRMWERIRR